MRKLQRFFAIFAHPSPVLVWSATAIGLLVKFAVFAWIAFDVYRSTLKSSFEVAENIAALIEQDIARNIELYDISLQAVSRHIQVLVRAGLVRQERSGRISRCSLDAAPIESAASRMRGSRRRADASNEKPNVAEPRRIKVKALLHAPAATPAAIPAIP